MKVKMGCVECKPFKLKRVNTKGSGCKVVICAR